MVLGVIGIVYGAVLAYGQTDLKRLVAYTSLALTSVGLCLGLQCAVIEFARMALGTDDANSSEFNVFTEHPVIDLMPDQTDVTDKGGTMRLGLYPARLEDGSRVREAYGTEIAYERHRHRFEVNNAYRERSPRQACGSAACRRMTASSSTSSCATTPGSWQRRRIPN